MQVTFIEKMAEKTPYLAKAKIWELFERLAAGDKSAEGALFHSHLMLVIKVVDKSWFSSSILTREDLLQEGALGLLKAIRMFDYKMRKDFLLFAQVAVEQKVHDAVQSNPRGFRHPINKIKEAFKLRRAEDKFFVRHGYAATPETIAAGIGLKTKNFNLIFTCRGDDVDYLSERPDPDNAKVTYADILTDKNYRSDKQSLIMEMVEKIISQLDCREQTIIKLYFGLDERLNGGASHLSHYDIGQSLPVKISAERVRQIKNQALNKIRRKIKKHLSLQSFAELDKTLGAGDKQVKTSL